MLFVYSKQCAHIPVFFLFLSPFLSMPFYRASISRALMSAFGRPYLMLAFYKVFWIIFTYVGSYFLVNRLISYVEDTPVDVREVTNSRDGYLYALGLFLTCVGSSICIQQVMAECTRIGVQVGNKDYLIIHIHALPFCLCVFLCGLCDLLPQNKNIAR